MGHLNSVAPLEEIFQITYKYGRFYNKFVKTTNS
jgi:hypothetical protein